MTESSRSTEQTYTHLKIRPTKHSEETKETEVVVRETVEKDCEVQRWIL